MLLFISLLEQTGGSVDIDMIREFVRLAETLNFTKTAKEFFITQPTLSRHLGIIEKELDTTLLSRTTHEVELTKDGQIAYKHCVEILKRYDAMVREIEESKTGSNGSFSLGFLYYGGMSYMRVGLERYMRSYPNVHIKFLSQQPYQVFESLLDDSIDVGLVFRDDGMPQDAYEFVPVHDCRMYAFMRKDHPLAGKGMLDFRDLEGQPLLLTEVDSWYNNAMVRIVNEQGVNMRPVKACNQIDVFPQALRENSGFLLGTGHMPCDPSEYITMLPLRHQPGVLTIGLYHRRDDKRPFVENFVHEWSRERE